LLFAKTTEVAVGSSSNHSTGMSPVFVEPTWSPEELNALEVVMGSGGGSLLTIKAIN
jgi:hypothetical protein